HGGRYIFLRETGTLEALRALARLELIPRDQVVDLDRGYRFLRQVEHRLQIEAEQQTHTIPRDNAALERLSRSLGFDDAKQFAATLKKTMERVRAIFDHFVALGQAESSPDDLSFF